MKRTEHRERHFKNNTNTLFVETYLFISESMQPQKTERKNCRNFFRGYCGQGRCEKFLT